RQAADGGRDGMRVADGTALLRGKERYVGGDAQLGARPDGPACRLDVLHAALRMPADEDATDSGGAFLASVHRLDAGIPQRLPYANTAEHQNAPYAPALQVIGGDTRGRNHLPIINRQSCGAQLRRLLRRRVGAAVGEERKRHLTRLERGQHFDRSRQELVAAERTIAEQQRAIDIEHNSPHGCPSARARARSSCGAHVESVRECVPPRSSSRKSLFTTLSCAMSRILRTRRSRSMTGFDPGS